MAVQQNHQSRSRRDQRRSHDSLTAAKVSMDKNSGEYHLRHNVTANGYYKGVKVVNAAVQDSDNK